MISARLNLPYAPIAFKLMLSLALASLLAGCLSANRLLPDRDPIVNHQQPWLVHHHASPMSCPLSCPQVRTVHGIFNPEVNFGCATQRNLALMIADPNDLIPQSRPPLRYAAKPLGQAVKRYEEGRLRPLTGSSR